MDPKVKTGIGAAQKGMKAVKVGKKALDMKKKLPGEKKKAMLKAAEKAAKKAVQSCARRYRPAVADTNRGAAAGYFGLFPRRDAAVPADGNGLQLLLPACPAEPDPHHCGHCPPG